MLVGKCSCPREPVMIRIPLFKLSTILWASCPQQSGVSRTGPCRASVGNGEYEKNTWRRLSGSCQQKQQTWSSFHLCFCMLVCVCVRMSGSSVCSILHARILEWTAMPSSGGIVPTQGRNPGLPRYRQILHHRSHQGTPGILEVGSLSLLQGIFKIQ